MADNHRPDVHEINHQYSEGDQLLDDVDTLLMGSDG